MSFSRNNENFLRFELYIPLKGLAGSERASKYDERIRTEARRRMRLYYENVKYDIPKKVAFYKDVLEIFGNLEKRWLLYSIYLDPHSDAISSQIGDSAIQYLELGNDPFRAFFEQKSPPHDGSFTKGFLKHYFTDKLELSPGDWKTEDGRNNPVTNKLINQLIIYITKGVANEELEIFLLNYTKLWNVYFTRTYNIYKGLVLIHKFYDLYRPLDPQSLKVDLKPLLERLNLSFAELLPEVFNSPLTDVHQPSEALRDGSFRSQANTKNYLTKIAEFQERLSMNTIFFQDLSTFDWSELMALACTTPLPAKNAYFIETYRRNNTGRPPTFSAINKFLQTSALLEMDSSTYAQVLSENYIFFG